MKKRILVHDFAGHPFQVQLSRELASRGHTVLHLYYGYNNTPKGNLHSDDKDNGSLSIEGVFTKELVNKYSFLKRWLQDLEYGRIISRRITEFAPDVLISANTPLDAQRYILSTCRGMGTRFVFWLQDVSGLAALKLLKRKIPLFGELIGNYHINLERRMLHQSDVVVLIAEDFRPIVESWGVKKSAINVIPNWAPLDEVPVREKGNDWAVRNNISDKFCFLYTGGLGLKHNPNLLLQLAIAFQDRNDVSVRVISEGPGASWLKEKKVAFGLDNLVIQDYQPFEQMPEVLASGDVLVAILEPDAGIFSVPSKVLTYLCAQRPLLLAVPSNNLAAKIVTKNHAGVVVEPGDVNGFVAAAKGLLSDSTQRERYAHNARIYAEKQFDVAHIGDNFEKIILQLS